MGVRIRLGQELPATTDKDLLPDQADLDIEVIPRAINVIAGQGSGLNWPVDAVESVPPLTGEQTPPGSDQAAQLRTEAGDPERVAAEDTARQEALVAADK